MSDELDECDDANPRSTSTLLKDRAVSTTFYVMPADHRRLQMLAVSRGVSMQTLIMDGIDSVLAREGDMPLERWTPRRNRRR